ncbi:Disease resistance protein [Quillaja saponaria]|uniref:Disease resistance protein n=1 Tax=Quillaja saponaria TaxID=32244 RepID=A0AAD7KQN2_QUISA|nr:Disease resistance protein [Quillaja saponaria]
MAEAIIQVVLENLNSLIQKEFGLLFGVHCEMEKLSSILTTIKAVLGDAEEKQFTDRAIKNWLKKIRDAAHELEDVLEECSMEFEAENSAGSSNMKVHCSCLSSSHPTNILFRYRIVNRMKEIKDRLYEIAEEKEKFHLREVVIGRLAETPGWRQTSSVITQPQVYGREADKEKIVEFLCGHDYENLSIYSIVGLGGLGKTTLSQLVFNDERVSKHFLLKIWVCVSEDFSLERMTKSIIQSATGKECGNLELDPLQRQLQEILKSKRYLLVLDDVWNEDQEKWDRLKYVLACGSKGSSIVVSTRLVKVAYIMGTVPPHELSCLSEADCWSLFKQRAFGPEREERESLVAIGKEIVKRCGGVPLAAKALGGLLRFKNEEKEWVHVKESELWNLPQDESCVLPALRLSYFNLSLNLRQCFAYCAIFNKDERLDKEHLIHLWMANGFISSSGNMEAEDVGNEVFAELYWRSLFQEAWTNEVGDVESFKMHDLVHDLAQSITEEEYLVVENIESLSDLSTRTHHVSSLNNLSKITPLRSTTLNMGILEKVKSLRTLLLVADDLQPSIPQSSVFRSLRSLRATPLKIGNLIHLRYLDLSNSKFTTLPESICSCWNLQTLKLNYCHYLVSLPKHLRRLRNLRHLEIRYSDSLTQMPLKIGELTNLKTLSQFVVGEKNGYRIGELHSLDLRRELEIKGLCNVRSALDARDANLIAKTGLKELSLSWSLGREPFTILNAADEQVLDAFQPHPNLRYLRINNYRGAVFPNWMRNLVSTLNNLVGITLTDFRHCSGFLPLGKLPCLRRLHLAGITHLQYIDNESYDGSGSGKTPFPSLEQLYLHDLPNLEGLLRDDGTVVVDESNIMFPRLDILWISSAPKLILPRLPSVRVLTVSSCNEEAEELLRSISNCCGLTTLRLSDCPNLTSLPDEMMRELTCLKELEINGLNKLEVLSNELIGLNALQILMIQNCDVLESFPEQALRGLISLQKLDVSSCTRLKSLSEGFQLLTSLQNLEIRCCPELVAFPNDISHLTSLRRLVIGGSLSEKNWPCVLPEGFQYIPMLQILSLQRLHVLSLPDCLGDLISLQRLEIIACPKLISLPESIQRLTNLQELKIRGCHPELHQRSHPETGR